MQDNETPIEDETTEVTVEDNTEVEPQETIGACSTSADAESDAPDAEPPTPVPVSGKYDAVYNPQAHSCRNNTPHRVKKVPRLFVRGEQIEIKGALFKVTAVGHKTMTLQLLPQPKETED